VTDLIREIFQPLYGKPCWQVHQGWGSFLTFDFGEPHLDINDQSTSAHPRRYISIIGDWHLWIYCCGWRIYAKDHELAHCESDEDTIRKATHYLNGQALLKVDISHDLNCIFEFDLGGWVEAFPNYDAYSIDTNLFFLFEPTKYVFALRADGYYQHHLPHSPSESHEWLPFTG
jgi:hypothetical protein